MKELCCVGRTQFDIPFSLLQTQFAPFPSSPFAYSQTAAHFYVSLSLKKERGTEREMFSCVFWHSNVRKHHPQGSRHLVPMAQRKGPVFSSEFGLPPPKAVHTIVAHFEIPRLEAEMMIRSHQLFWPLTREGLCFLPPRRDDNERSFFCFPFFSHPHE